jgi:hypothetical protein
MSVHANIENKKQRSGFIEKEALRSVGKTKSALSKVNKYRKLLFENQRVVIIFQNQNSIKGGHLWEVA